MTKKEKLLKYIAHKKEEQYLFCIHIVKESGQKITSYINVPLNILIEYIMNFYNNDLVKVENDVELEMNSYVLLSKKIE